MVCNCDTHTHTGVCGYDFKSCLPQEEKEGRREREKERGRGSGLCQIQEK